MYIMNEAGTEILNSEFVERFCIARKPDATLIVASYSENRYVTVARYSNEKEAFRVLGELFGALAAGQTYFDMPASLMFAEQFVKKDARTKRKGGS